MTVRALHLWFAKTSLERALRAAERVLPVVTEALPADRRHRARGAFARLKAALADDQVIDIAGLGG